MENLTKKIMSLLKDNVVRALYAGFSVLGKAIDCIREIRSDRASRKREKEDRKRWNRIENACDEGDLNDILNALRNVFAPIALCCVCGCLTIEINAVRTWEGRYDSSEKAAAALSGARLERGESVWVLSNETLKRLLTEKTEGTKR